MGEGAGADAVNGGNSGNGGNEPNGPIGAMVGKFNRFARMGAGQSSRNFRVGGIATIIGGGLNASQHR